MLNTQNTPKIYTTSSHLCLPTQPPTNIVISISAYVDCVFVVVNEGGTIGSIMRGTVDQHARIEQQQQQWNTEQPNPSPQPPTLLYTCKCLFGSTQIPFYELLLRKITELVYEKHGMKLQHNGQKTKVILNVSLSKVHKEEFRKMEEVFYGGIVGRVGAMLEEVL